MADVVAADAMEAEVDVAAAAGVAAVVGMEAALAGMEAAEASALEVAAAGAVVVVAAAGEIAWYGHLCGPGAAGVSPHLPKRYLMSRRSYRHGQLRLRKELTHTSVPHELNSVRHRHLSHCATAPAASQSSPLSTRDGGLRFHPHKQYKNESREISLCSSPR